MALQQKSAGEKSHVKSGEKEWREQNETSSETGDKGITQR